MTSPTTDRRQGLVGNTPIKAPIALATTGPITLSGEQIIDGVMTSASRVLVKDQANPIQNGIYDSSSASWTRTYDADGTYDVAQGTMAFVTGGVSNANALFSITSAAPVVGSTPIVWRVINSILNLASSIGASLVGFIQLGVGAILRTVMAKLREEVSADDYGADPAGTVDSFAAIMAAFVASPFVKLTRSGNYKTSQQIALPVGGTLSGAGRGSTTLTATANVPAVQLNAFSKVRRLQIRQSFGGHSVNLVEVGSATISARCASLEELDVASAGQDNIAVINGNLGSIGNISSTSATRDNLSFYGGLPNTNAWRSFGYIDLNAAGRDNLHIGGGTSLGDANASRTHILTFAAQSAGRYNAYVGSRSNLLCAYVEAGTTADVFFDTFGQGNELRAPESSVVIDNAATANSNLIYNGNLGAGYVRGFLSKVIGSGFTGKGFGLYNDDSTAGQCYWEKRGARNYVFAAATSGATAQTSFVNDVAGVGINHQVAIQGALFPLTTNTYTCGVSSFAWSGGFTQVAFTITSDGDTKTEKRAYSDPEIAAATAMADLPCLYKLKTSVAEKGSDAARWHSGMVAQAVAQCFVDQGLDPARYAMWCSDPVMTGIGDVLLDANGQPIMEGGGEPMVDRKGKPLTNEDGTPMLHPGFPMTDQVGKPLIVDGVAQVQLALRYEEAHSFIIAALAQKLRAFETRLARLEALLPPAPAEAA